MKVYVYVSPAAAIRAGKSHSGVIPVELSEADIAAMSSEERELLASVGGLDAQPRDDQSIIGRRRYDSGRGIAIVEPTPTGVVGWLRDALRAEGEQRQAVIAKARATVAEWLATGKVPDDVDVGAAGSSPKQDLSDADKVAWYGGDGLKLSRGDVDAATWGALTALIHRARKQQAEEAARAQAEAEAKARSDREARARLLVESLARTDTTARRATTHEPGDWVLVGPDGAVLVGVTSADGDAQAELERRAKALEDRKRQALRAAVSDWGSDVQRARQTEGLLSEDEALALVRERVFAPFADLERYRRLDGDELEHDDDCPDARARFDVDSADALTDAQFLRLRAIRAAAPEGAEVEPRIHTASCGDCSARAVSRASALVTLDWHGHQLSREYALDE